MDKTQARSPRDSRSAKAERVIAAATLLFAANGFAATRMDAIVEEARVSKSTVYSHYANKEALFAATVAQGTRRVAGEMTLATAAAQAADQPIEAELERLANSYIESLLEQDKLGLFRLIVAESGRFPKLGRIFHQNVALHPRHASRAALERACNRGQLAIDDCEQAATQFLALVRSDLQIRALIGLPTSRASVTYTCRQAVDTFMARYRPA